ncbi:MAG TPA: CpaF family protein [Candidatus Angelobacter sp.]|jgi:pilus assembly protein CpaF|nr:CpaF family protein [Candidatus Angelobacter sp.]
MSLLDRVQQRRTGDESPGFGAQSRPVAPAAPSAPAPAAPAPNGAATAVVDGPGQNRGASPLLNRTGLGQRASLSKSSALQERYDTLRGRVHSRLVEEMVGADNAEHDTVVAKIGELVSEVAVEMALTISRQDKQRLVDHLVNDVLGLGPLEQLLADPDVTEVMINGPKNIYVEQRGRITRSAVTFESTDQLMQVIDRIVSSIGRRVDESSPMVDARLKDGSRVNVIIPPLALTGPTVTIRKFSKDPLQISDLLKYGSVTQDMVDFLHSCVAARMNVVVSGGTGSGKTTTLNILSGFIPNDERIVTIEDAAELQLRQEHVVTLETRPANVEGRGRIAIRELVINSLRMRPDRIVVGECRGGEALDMLQAMNTGHDGSLTTVHANSPHDALSRLETMVLMAGAELPSRAIREQISSAINIIVQQSRLRDGTRKVVSIAEVLGYDGERVQLQDIFVFKQTGVDGDGHVLGQLTPTGVIPQCLEHLAASGEGLDVSIFTPHRTAVSGGEG